MTRIDLPNLISGLLVIAITLPFALEALQYPLDESGSVGPGAFPLGVAVVGVVLGLVICVRSLRRSEAFAVPYSVRAPAAVLGAIAAFALLIQQVGLIPTLAAVTGIAALATKESRFVPVIALAAGVGVGCWLIFVVFLGMTIPAFRIPL